MDQNKCFPLFTADICHNNLSVCFTNGGYLCISHIVFRGDRVFVSLQFLSWIKAIFNSFIDIILREQLTPRAFLFQCRPPGWLLWRCTSTPLTGKHDRLKKCIHLIQFSIHTRPKRMWIRTFFPPKTKCRMHQQKWLEQSLVIHTVREQEMGWDYAKRLPEETL